MLGGGTAGATDSSWMSLNYCRKEGAFKKTKKDKSQRNDNCVKRDGDMIFDVVHLKHLAAQRWCNKNETDGFKREWPHDG